MQIPWSQLLQQQIETLPEDKVHRENKEQHRNKKKKRKKKKKETKQVLRGFFRVFIVPKEISDPSMSGLHCQDLANQNSISEMKTPALLLVVVVVVYYSVERRRIY